MNDLTRLDFESYYLIHLGYLDCLGFFDYIDCLTFLVILINSKIISTPKIWNQIILHTHYLKVLFPISRFIFYYLQIQLYNLDAFFEDMFR